MKDILKGSLLSLIAKVASALITVIFTVVVTRTLDTSDSGLFLFFITIVLVTSNIARFGVDKHLIKELSSSDNGSNNEKYLKYLLSNLIPIFIVSLIIASILYVKSSYVLKSIFPNFRFEDISFAFFAIPFYNLCLLVANFFQVVKKSYIYILALNFIQQFLTLIIVSILLLINKEIYLFDICISYLLGCIIASTLLTIYSIKQVKWKSKRFMFDKDIFYSSIKASLPLFVVVIFNLIINWSSQFILASFSTPDEVSIFTVCLRLVMLISFILVAINSVTAPKYAALFKINDVANVRKVFLFSIKISIAFSLLTSVFFIVFGKLLLSFFGEAYSSAYPILLIMMIGQIVSVLCGSVSYVLQMKGDYKTVMNFNILAGVFSLVVSFLLIRNYGLTGSAIAYSISLAVLNLVLLARVLPIIKVK